MFDALRPVVLRLLRVPAEPQPPAGAAGSLRVFRAARGYLWICLLRWAGRQAATLIGLIAALFFFHGMSGGQLGPRRWDLGAWLPVMYAVEAFGLLVFLAQLPFTLFVTLLDYEQRWYLVTDRSLRIRTGIWTVDELTMTYANVQELTVHQGPLQRMLGISDLKVRSAGGGGNAGGDGQSTRETHVGYFHGVGNAGEIRDLILAYLRGLKDAGLGDPDESHRATGPARVGGVAVSVAATAARIEAARSLLDEVRRLRRALSDRREGPRGTVPKPGSPF